jgi:hypothetical protein
VKCEAELLLKLRWDLMVLTPLHFLYSMLSMGIIFETDKKISKHLSKNGDTQYSRIDSRLL